MPESRPRITFNEEGVCNACQWSEKKKSIDWRVRTKQFEWITQHNGIKEVLVPWSGGKDSIYVAYKMRELGLNPTLITVLPHMETSIGQWNRINTCKDFTKVEINLEEKKYRSLAKKYFIEQGRPKHPWECAISASVINYAYKNNFKLIMYGEEGEAEYGGSTSQLEKWAEPVDKEYLMKYYWQGSLDWEIPDDLSDIFFTQWSRFENWSPSKHGNFAVAKGMRCGGRNIGTFTIESQLSDKLQDLHCYLMYLKFGFGRCTSDVSIAIREGWMDKVEGGELIDAYDGEFPMKYVDEYLDYFNMTSDEFFAVLGKFEEKGETV